MTHFHKRDIPGTDEIEKWEVEYKIHPGQPEIMPEQPFYPDELEISSIKDDQGREIPSDEISVEEWEQIEDECWKDSKVEY